LKTDSDNKYQVIYEIIEIKLRFSYDIFVVVKYEYIFENEHL